MIRYRKNTSRIVNQVPKVTINIEEVADDEEPKISWIEQNFTKRECIKYIPVLHPEGFQRCVCGKNVSEHGGYLEENAITKKEAKVLNQMTPSLIHSFPNTPVTAAKNIFHRRGHSRHHSSKSDFSLLTEPQSKWHAMNHTKAFPTDAFGTLEFQGTGEGDKAQFIRLAHDTQPDLALRLLVEEWRLNLPKMVITVHGGVHNFALQSKLRRVFCNGLIKAATTTGAWIMSFGLSTGIGEVIGSALKDYKSQSRDKICSIGVAPWGVVDNREDLIGTQGIRSYQTMANPISKGAVLHAAYTHFLLVDNGTEGRYDSELKFRRRLEKRLSLQDIHSRHGRMLPIVCLVLEGGKNTINVVLESVRQNPPIPVIICDGSGRAADLLSFAHQYADDDGTLMEDLRLQFLKTIQQTFKCAPSQAKYIMLTIMECVRKKDLITIFRMGEGQNPDADIDKAILVASLKARSYSAPDMLSLALTWNRIDIATSQIFVYGQNWPVLSLEQAMMDALILDRVDFVKLLMENGVSMHKFLTVSRLEELYNIKQMPLHLVYLLRDVMKNVAPGCRITLINIGQVIEQLMGGAYRSNYTKKKFRLYYASKQKPNGIVKKQTSFSKTFLPSVQSDVQKSESFSIPLLSYNHKPVQLPENQQNILPKDFSYPFHELLVWSVLMKRQKMALFMWQNGEEAIAKALVAAKLYRMMAKEAADDDLDVEESEELKKYANEFYDLSMQLLELCYHTDDDATEHLLTSELKHWGKHTCLSLAVAAQHRDFIAHPCVQLLLNDLWMGGLDVRKNSSLRVILGILLPLSLMTLEFKSKEELLLMPMTIEEHMDAAHDYSSISSSSSSSLSSSSTSSTSSTSSSSISSSSSGPDKKPDVVGREMQYMSPDDVYLLQNTQEPQLPMRKKIYEFYNAPITKFWLYTMNYTVTLVLFTYVVLVKMSKFPSVVEWYIITFIFTLTLERIREIHTSEPSGAWQKLKLWFGKFWNSLDALMIIFFFVGFALRMAQDDYLLLVGHVLYCVDIVFWYTRLFNLFSASKYLGPFVTMMGKMMVDMGTFIILLAVVLVTFGVSRQAILHPKEEAQWSTIRDVLMEPYFMLYGEVYAPTIDPCAGEDPSLCVTGSWIVPAAMTLYLLVANILLLNLLIAVFNNTFTKVKIISDKIWRFQRYTMIVEYEARTVCPPPFIIFSYLIMIFRKCCKKHKRGLFSRDCGLKLYLDDDDVEKLHDFEEECLSDLFRKKDVESAKKGKAPTDELSKVYEKLEEVNDRETATMSYVQALENHLVHLEETNVKMLETLLHLSKNQRISSNTVFTTDDSSDCCSSDSDESNTEIISGLHSMKARLAMRSKRIRQDSEMSTASEFQPNMLMRKLSLHIMEKEPRQRHVSENLVAKPFPVNNLKKCSSTGDIFLGEKASSKDLISSNVISNASLRNCARLFPDTDELKSRSCQDILLLNAPSKQRNVLQPPVIDIDASDIESGYLFRSAEDINVSPEDMKRSSEDSPLFRLPGEHSDRDSNVSDPRQSPDLRILQNGSLKFKKDPINLGQKHVGFCSDTNLARSGSIRVIPKITVNRATSPRSKSESSDTKKKSFLRNRGQTLPCLSKPLTPISPPSRPYNCNPSSYDRNAYASITDCIDTTQWYNINTTPINPPTTPFERWHSKMPDFPMKQGSHETYQDVISPDEWEGDRNGERRVRLYSTSSNTSMFKPHKASSSSHRHKKRKPKKHAHQKKHRSHQEKNKGKDSKTSSLETLQETSSSRLNSVRDDSIKSRNNTFTASDTDLPA